MMEGSTGGGEERSTGKRRKMRRARDGKEK